MPNEAFAIHHQELRRGTVVMAALATLARPAYGYALLETLQEVGVTVDANTLYPLLRRLEKQGLLASQWDTEGSRPRKFYRTTEEGRALLSGLLAEWRDLHTTIEALADPVSPADDGTGSTDEPDLHQPSDPHPGQRPAADPAGTNETGDR